jgi:hypothetical protein
MHSGIVFAVSAALFTAPAFTAPPRSAVDSVTVGVQWNDVTAISKTVPTTQHLASSYTLRNHPLNRPLLKALRDLRTNDTRLQLWFSIPNQAVAELKEPTATQTFWDFKYIDPVVIDFYANTSGLHNLNVGTIPRWMFNVPSVDVPSDPAATFYDYRKGTTGDLLKDPTGRQFADYQVRIYQWYTQGGFTDEIGNYHKSGHHFKIDYWGILNEPNSENKISVEEYTKIYDAVAEAIHKIDPKVQFFGPEVAGVEIPWATYFLNSTNHSPGAPPVQWFSFHNYVDSDNDPTHWQVKYFTGEGKAKSTGGVPALEFADRVREVLKIRDELSPKTQIAIDELGTFDFVKPGDHGGGSDETYNEINPRYWVAMGANWAADFITAENLEIPIISMTQMLGYPRQSPACSMINSDTGRPNAHWWVLKLINNNFRPGDKLVASQSSSRDVVAQASITASGRKVLLVNTSNRTVAVNLSSAFSDRHLNVEVVDEASGENAPRKERITGARVSLTPFAVAVVKAGSK